MGAEMKKSYASMAILIGLGILALYAGAHWLTVLVPAAIMVRYAVSGASFRSRRN